MLWYSNGTDNKLSSVATLTISLQVMSTSFVKFGSEVGSDEDRSAVNSVVPRDVQAPYP